MCAMHLPDKQTSYSLELCCSAADTCLEVLKEFEQDIVHATVLAKAAYV